MVHKAVIVAAGLSSRLYPLTLERPKGLLEVGGQPMLTRSVQLLQQNGINDIAIVVGYRHNQIREALGRAVSYIANPFYRHCNNMGSLWFAQEHVADNPFIYLHGDIVYDPAILSSALEGFVERKNDMELVSDFKENDEEAMKVRVDKNGRLLESSKEISLEKAHGEWIGIACVRSTKELFASIEAILFNEGLNFYDTHAFTKLAKQGSRIFCTPTNGLPWVEVDFAEDYQLAKELFQ